MTSGQWQERWGRGFLLTQRAQKEQRKRRERSGEKQVPHYVRDDTIEAGSFVSGPWEMVARKGETVNQFIR